MAKFQGEGGLSSVPPLPKPPKDKDAVVPKKEDVQLIVSPRSLARHASRYCSNICHCIIIIIQMSEFEVSKPVAERALVQAKGNLKNALEILIGVPQKEEVKEEVKEEST